MVNPHKPEERQLPDTVTFRLDIKNVAEVFGLMALIAIVVVRLDPIMAALGFVWSVLSPFVGGIMVAYLLNLIMVRWERVWFPKATQGPAAATRRAAGIVLSLATVAAVIAFIVALVSGEIAGAFASLWSALTEILALFGIDLEASLAEFFSATGDASALEQIEALGSSLLDSQSLSAALEAVMDAGSLVVNAVTNAVISVVFAIYLLAAKERSLAALNRIGRLLLPERTYRGICHVCTTANGCLSRFFYGQFTEGIVLGSLCAVGMAILRLPYAATIGFVVGVGALVPIVGAWCAGIVGALIILPVDVGQAVEFVVFLLILQQVDGQLIYPRVVGHSVGVSSIWVLVSVFVGGGLFGVVGMLAGVPTAATIIVLAREWAERREAALAAEAADGAAAAGTTDAASAGETDAGDTVGAVTEGDASAAADTDAS